MAVKTSSVPLLKDPCSASNINNYIITHIDWDIYADFKNKIINSTVNFFFKTLIPSIDNVLLLDTRDLIIERVYDTKTNKNIKYELVVVKDIFGTPVKIYLPFDSSQNEFEISIKYKTSQNAFAIQWLAPEQTLGLVQPYMFTQCQAIHARTLLPCQDTPGVKFTYSARLNVPIELVGLMGATNVDAITADGKLSGVMSNNDRMVYTWKQPIPIPSYLVGIAIGDLKCRKIGKRSYVWCEDKLLDECANEFSEIDTFINIGEDLAGDYVWGPCNLLVLPPSYPYGGMEHPCLIFVTPTLLAGDKSLASVLIHEIAHSWTGNLVTCINWEHFWLNEGFTVFLERKIISRLKGEVFRHLEYINGYKSLTQSIGRFGVDHEYSKLIIRMQGVDPDDAFSSVPYEKGSAFLFYLESLVGGPENFDPFIKAYVLHFKQTGLISSDLFKNFFLDYFAKENENGIFKDLDWNQWYNSSGMPPADIFPSCYNHQLQAICTELANDWLTCPIDKLDKKTINIFNEMSSLQKQEFFSILLNSDKILDNNYLSKMSEFYEILKIKNSEIKFLWLRLCLKANWELMYPQVTAFLCEQGRMKFVRPLYRELHNAVNGKKMAEQLLLSKQDFYHNICLNMIKKDLNIQH